MFVTKKTTEMRLKFILSVLIILSSQMLGAQDFKTLYGKVTNAEDGSALHLASVNLSGSNISNVTNADGVFSLKIPADTRPDAMVRITYLGYDRILVPVSAFDRATADNPQRIRMVPSVLTLDAARIIEYDADAMFDYAYHNISRNYPQEHEAMTAFYREIVMKNNSKYLSMNEAVLDIDKAPYYLSGGDKAGIYKGRGSSNYDQTDSLLVSYKGGVTGALLLDMVKNPYAGVLIDRIQDVHKYYLFEMGIPATIDGRSFTVIQFDQNPDVKYALYRGRIYIDPDTYAIARFEFDLNVEAYPEVVYEGQDGFLGINYIELVPILIRSIQEMQQEIESLRNSANNTPVTEIDIVGQTSAKLYQKTKLNHQNSVHERNYLQI